MKFASVHREVVTQRGSNLTFGCRRSPLVSADCEVPEKRSPVVAYISSVPPARRGTSWAASAAAF